MADGYPTWLSATRQRWKLFVFLLLMSAEAGQLVALILALRGTLEGDTFIVTFGVGSALTLIIAMVWLAFSIRCPACGRRPGWFALSHANVSTWLGELLHSTRCMICHDRPRTRFTA